MKCIGVRTVFNVNVEWKNDEIRNADGLLGVVRCT
jgi:hypothetical protein